MHSLLFLHIFIVSLSLSYHVSATETQLCLSVGSTIVLDCVSSFAPPWSKIGPKIGDYRTIGVNGKRHPKWKEPRFVFNNEKSVYKITINELSLSDAGTYVCEGDSSTSYVLSVIR